MSNVGGRFDVVRTYRVITACGPPARQLLSFFLPKGKLGATAGGPHLLLQTR